MKGIVRHWGIPCQNLERSISWYRHFGVHDLQFSTEIWTTDFYKTGGTEHKLKIVKMRDDSGNILELIQNDWKPHIALTLYEGTMDDLWLEFAKEGTLVAHKGTAHAEIVYLRDPDGNYIEVVKEL
jgi:catechol 2,3-dioxygenase-like lactoylglutathione lyase family enzyme